MRYLGIEPEAAARMEAWVPKAGFDPHQVVGLRISYGDEKTYDVIRQVDSAVGHGVTAIDGWVDADALITTNPGVALLLPTADCYPVVLYDPNQKVLALLHLGWQSTDADMVRKVIDHMVTDFGADPKGMHVYVGPGITKESYRFAELAQQTDPRWSEHLHHAESSVGIDLLGYNLAALKTWGISDRNITVAGINTASDDRYYSHYGTHKLQKPVEDGRFVTVAMIEPT